MKYKAFIQSFRSGVRHPPQIRGGGRPPIDVQNKPQEDTIYLSVNLELLVTHLVVKVGVSFYR